MPFASKPFLALSLTLLASSAAAQSYTARRIEFKNAGNFSQAQLETAAGLHAGSHFTRDDLANAAQKLSDSGYFDNVGAAVDGNNNQALTVIFALTPSAPAQFLPTGFENFVWLTPDEIQKAIQARLPLYNGTLPEAGPQPDAAIEALTAALLAKRISAGPAVAGHAFPETYKIERETIEPTLLHPLRVLEFRITQPQLVVKSIKLGGVTPALVPLLQKSVNRTAGTLYNEGRGGVLTSELILAPLLDAGYEQAALSQTTLDIASPASGQVDLVLSTTLAPGSIYKLGSINFAGTPMFSAADFAKSARLKPGDVASRNVLLATLEPLDAAYRDKGYIDVIVKADPTFNTAASTVDYAVSVTPGEPYHLKDITTEGLDPAAKADFDKYFLLHTGDVYNRGYVQGFLKNNTALFSLAHYSGSFKAYAHPDTRTVDLVLTFNLGGNRNNVIVVH